MTQRIGIGKSLLLLVLSLASSLPLSAQEATLDEEKIARILKILNGGEDAEVNVRKLLAESFSERSRYLDLSYLQPDDDDLDSGWNAKYNLNYSTSAGNGFSADADRFELDAYSTELDISGSYSFDDAANTDDLSSVRIALSYMNVDLGRLDVISSDESEALQRRCFQMIKNPDPGDFSVAGQLDEAAFEAAAEEVLRLRDECRKTVLPRPIRNAHRSRSYAFDLHATVEGNQDYSSKNVAYGIQALYSARGWPSLRIDLERVDASENEERAAISSKDEFDRVAGEIGYQYAFGGDRDGYPFVAYLSYRFFHELSAPAEIDAADLETFDYVAVSLRFAAAKFGLLESKDPKLFLRYTEGRLPFDRQDDRALEFGFSTNIGILNELL